MTAPDPSVEWIDRQAERMVGLVVELAWINSGSHHLQGLARMAGRLQEAFAPLGGAARQIELPGEASIDERGHAVHRPLGRALSIRKRADAPLRVLLCIHMDTVYGADDPFQAVERVEANTLRGPGVADAKGGIVVMLVALEALERSAWAGRIGWEVLLNPDEELGSPGSATLLAEAAQRNHVGLVFEPAYADGTMVGERKGSGNFSVILRGRAAHAGRDFASGRSAVHAASQYVVEAAALNGAMPGVTVNVGRIDGGGPTNVVADLAIVRLNARVAERADQSRIEAELNRIASQVAQRHEVAVELHGRFLSPPMRPTPASLALRGVVDQCGRQIGLDPRWTASGGVSDANRLADAGLPVVDTMGPRGGALHSPGEFVRLDSLPERAKLAALVLQRLAENPPAFISTSSARS